MIADLAADSIFGEMALIDSEPRRATAVAITDVELVPISEKQFLFLVSQTPYFALKVMRTLAQRLRATILALRDASRPVSPHLASTRVAIG
jgi:CRP-like cAMP-binding protein